MVDGGLDVTSAAAGKMRGRPRHARRPRRPPLPPRLPQLLLMLAVIVASASVEDGWNHIPQLALWQLKHQPLTLPNEAMKFDHISTGQQLYPKDARYSTLTAVSLCVCRNRCLTEPRCMGYEYEKKSGECGLTDILLPANTTEETETLEWSTGRRRGISWLGAPCHSDTDCSLLINGAECGLEKICTCERGWTPLNEMLCRPDTHWVKLPGKAFTGDLVVEKEAASLHSCWDICEDSAECWAVEHQTPTLEKEQAGECRIYGSAKQDRDILLSNGSTAYQIRLGWVDNPPNDMFTDIGGRFFHLTDKVAGSGAAEKCLDAGGVQYVPDSLTVVKRIYNTLEIRTDLTPLELMPTNIGIGFNDVLNENRFDTADGSALDAVSFRWSKGQPDDLERSEKIENCGSFMEEHELNDIGCSRRLRHLCEYVGPGLNISKIESNTKEDGIDEGITWLAYRLEEQQPVSRVLYIAPGDETNHMEVVEIRVGSQPHSRSGRQSTRCLHQTARVVAGGFARRFTCAVPLFGRYLHLAQRSTSEPPSDPEPRIAVFGVINPTQLGFEVAGTGDTDDPDV